MTYQCPIAIEFTPRGGSGSVIVLVPADGWLSELPQFEASQQLYEADGVLLAEAFFRPLGGATVVFALAVEIDESTRLAAQNAFLANSLPASGELSFIATGWRCDFAQASISDVTPGLPSGTPAATHTRTLQVTTGLPAYSLTP